ncbi:MAG: DUF3306 domain-containing protein [Burkholderiales bacterium]|nr:DUF3306 domain-containing protein [Burkholderiales bacterium]
MNEGDGFIARWSRRKSQARDDGTQARAEVTAPAPAPPSAPAMPTAPETPLDATPPSARPPDPTSEPAPTLADVAALTPESDFGRYVATDVTAEVRNAALRKLFADPRYNVMDGLDSTFEDYTRPDPLPPGMLREMAQSQLLGLFDADADAGRAPDDPPPSLPPSLPPSPPPPPAPSPPNLARPDENADLQLQPDDDTGRAGAAPRAGGDGQP